MLAAMPQDTLSPLLLKCAMSSLFMGCSRCAGPEFPLKTLSPCRISPDATATPPAIAPRPGFARRGRRARDEISLTLERRESRRTRRQKTTPTSRARTRSDADAKIESRRDADRRRSTRAPRCADARWTRWVERGLGVLRPKK